MSTFIANPDETRELLPRFKIFYVTLVISFTVFAIRLWLLQIVQGTELRDFSEKNHLKQAKVMAPRGLILDREGRVLVSNDPGFEAVLAPQYVKDLEELSAQLGPILGIDPDKLLIKIQRSRRQNGPFASVKLKENLTRDEVFRMKKIRLATPGLDIREIVTRKYPLGENGAQMFGYVAEISKKQLPIYNQIYKDINFEQGDIVGKAGMEEIVERDIRGKDGMQFLQVDALGREAVARNAQIYGEGIQDISPVPGSNITLTIDKDIQEAAYKAMVGLDRLGGVIAMKSNGEILAWVSLPSFDPNAFSKGMTPGFWSKLINDPFKPMVNKVIQDHYFPGSSFKPFMAMAALEEKVITPTTYINCPGQMWFGKRPYHDSVKGGHGNITVYEAIEKSSNIFFFKMGIALGIDRMFNYISPFGLGSRTGIEFPREIAGTLPNSEWKLATTREPWQPGETLTNAIGQGFVQVTPIQMAVAYNAIGLEGKVIQPYLIQKVVDLSGKVVKENSPKTLRNLTDLQKTGIKYSPETFKVVKEAMRRVVQGERGTARSMRIPGVEIAGKTGTSQVMGFSASDIYSLCEKRPLTQRHHGWFVGFSPADNPEITVSVVTLHSCHGGSGAGPVVKAIVEAYFKKYHPEKIEEGIRLAGIKKSPAVPRPPPKPVNDTVPETEEE